VGAFAALAIAAPAGAVTIKEFPTDNGQLPRYIHVGPDQNLWFTEVGASIGAVGRISTAGEHFAPIVVSNKPVDLVTMPDGTVVWTTDALDGLTRRLPDGRVDPNGRQGGAGYAIAVTSSGALRWTAQGSVDNGGSEGYVCQPHNGAWGAHADCTIEPIGGATRLTGLALGADGRLWTVAYEKNGLFRMDSSSNEFDLNVALPIGSGPARLAQGPDGNLWVTMYDASAIDRIAANGSRLPRFQLAPGRGPNDIVEGPDGALWFTELKGDAIGRITPTGQVQEFPLAPGAQPEGITTGPDGALWFTESGAAKIGRLQLDAENGGNGVVDQQAPRFTEAPAFHPKRFRVARGAIPRSARRRTPPRGSSLSYAVSEPALVTVVIARRTAGRKVGKRCRPLSRANRTKRRCTHYVTAGTLVRHGLQGLNKIAFTGRIGRRALRPGTYRLMVTAKDAAGNGSAPSTTSFTIVR
jgi:streptogramin lyase